jgi:hypothetical protein
VKLLINTDETAESLEVAGDRMEAGGQRAVIDPGKEFWPDPRVVAREEEEEGAGQPGANKMLLWTTSPWPMPSKPRRRSRSSRPRRQLHQPPSEQPLKRGGPKSPLAGAEDARGRTWVRLRKEGAGSLVDAARQRQQKCLLFSARSIVWCFQGGNVINALFLSVET